MKTFIYFLSIFFFLECSGQIKNINVKKHFIVFAGHINNNEADHWDFTNTGFFNPTVVSVPVDKNGNFFTKIKIGDYVEDLILHIGNGIYIYVQKNDTITINWDAKNIKDSFELKAAQKDRDQELKTLVTSYKLYQDKYIDLQLSSAQKQTSDPVKFISINQLYNSEIETALASGINHVHTSKVIADIYYKYVKILLNNKLLPAYDLFLINPLKNSSEVPFLNLKLAYQTESEEFFRNSFYYRNFIASYVRLFRPFRSTTWLNNQPTAQKMTVTVSPPWSDYYNGLNYFRLKELRDWYITQSVMFDFAHYTFNDSRDVYRDFLKKEPSQFYADTLKAFFNGIKKLKPGSPAPIFCLKNEIGQTVSLSDFKGSMVYIDFWGVTCSPCIYDIKNYVPLLYERYKGNNIIFLNICVDATTTKWKQELIKLHLRGVNLIAPGFPKSSIFSDYNVYSVPHHFLIDANGNMVDNNCPRPSEMLTLYPLLDALLK